MNAEDVALIVSLCRSRAGLELSPEKTYLMESRIGPIARRESYDSIPDLLAAIRARRDETLIWAVVEAVAGGESAFFRDRSPFQSFREELVPQLARARAGQAVRVWSAACATGQEIYSLAMLSHDMAAEDPSLRVELAASDLSAKALERAQSGIYNQFEVQRGLPIRLLARHFEKQDDMWRVAEPIRGRVRWRRINLVAGLTAIGRFDIVFCRYVLGTMSAEAQKKVLTELTTVIPEDGFLVVGQKETIPGLSEGFQPIVGRPGIFRRNPASRAAVAA